MWTCLQGKPQDASAVCLCRVRLLGEWRPGRRHQHPKGGIRPDRLPSEQRSKLSAAGTLRKGRLNGPRRNPLPFRFRGGLRSREGRMSTSSVGSEEDGDAFTSARALPISAFRSRRKRLGCFRYTRSESHSQHPSIRVYTLPSATSCDFPKSQPD